MDKQKALQKIGDVLTKECKEYMHLMMKLFLIALLCCALKQIQLENQSHIYEMIFYVCYLMISILIISEFMIVFRVCKETISVLNGFNGVFVPIMMLFLGLSGNLATASALQTTMLIFIATLSNITIFILLPLTMTVTLLGLVSNISQMVDVSAISNLIKKISLWIVEVSMIIFVFLLSIEGTLTENVDSVTAKTVKSVISNTVPVVGKLIRRRYG